MCRWSHFAVPHPAGWLYTECMLSRQEQGFQIVKHESVKLDHQSSTPQQLPTWTPICFLHLLALRPFHSPTRLFVTVCCTAASLCNTLEQAQLMAHELFCSTCISHGRRRTVREQLLQVVAAALVCSLPYIVTYTIPHSNLSLCTHRTGFFTETLHLPGAMADVVVCAGTLLLTALAW